jgi:small conductance mechanosensitive channel
MLVENQIRVGDVAMINGTSGLVEEANLRTTVLRSFDGTVHVIPNGTVSMLSNMTRGFSFYVLDVSVAYKEDTDRVVEVLRQIGAAMMEDDEYKADMLESVEILGVDRFADSAVVIKGRIKTQPVQQWKVGREFNRRMKKRFDELGIEIPFPQRSLHFSDAGPPITLGLDGSMRDAVREVVREVIEEERRGSR